MLSNTCSWKQCGKRLEHGLFLLACAVICALAPASLATNQKSDAAKKEQALNKSVEERTLVFPKIAELGKLFLVPHTSDGMKQETVVGTAFGTVKVHVPKNEFLVLSLNRQALQNPQCLDSCSATGVDGITISFLSMDDNENEWCDAALKHANHFKNLKCLTLNRSDVSDAAVSAMTDLRDLQFFAAFETRIKGYCFKTLSRNKNLRNMSCFDDAIEQENLKYLSDCPRLSAVDVRRTGIGDVGVKYLSECPNIATLRLGGNPRISDACTKYLLNLKHVEWLDLDGTRVTFKGLKALKPMHLHLLSVTEGTCSAKELPVLKGLAKQVQIVSRARGMNKDEQLFAPMR
jgi:hypothetical protein